MNSRIYRGTIEHRRYFPVDHHLSYPIYLYGFDLADLHRLDQRYPLFGYNRAGVTSIHDQDYLQPGTMGIKQKIGQLLDQQKMGETVASIIMISSARYFNYVFNPVNFHYCFTKDKTLVAVVAEVNNTYGERHPYVLTKKISPSNPSNGWFAEYEAQKVFHVSPFNKIEGTYHFYFSAPEDQINIKIELIRENQKIMAATFSGHSIPMTRSNHLKTLVKYPAAPHLSVPRIYAHAFRLFFKKRMPFHDKPVPRSTMTLTRQTPSLVEKICKQLLLSALKRIKTGCLQMELPDKRVLRLGDKTCLNTAILHIREFNFFYRIVFDGEIGFGESYMLGEWDSPDLVAVLKLLIENRDQFADGNMMLSLLTRIQEKLSHDGRKNTIENTPRNIADHYDLSNDLYALFLDQQMIYSCGIFVHPEDSLEAAQRQKMQRILDQADVDSNHHLLEIGCGWGGFAVFAVKQTGCRVTGITVSKAQYTKACQRVKDEGLEDRITILLQDYRHTTGTFDRIVSIEMIEAVGPQFLQRYFQKCSTLLKPGGIFVFQAIIIVDDRYEQYCKERDWIQKHIFPGGHLPCLKILDKTITESTDFQIADVYHMGPHYAATLALWQKRFFAHKEKVHSMGFDREFFRKWNYYFSICEAGFATSGIDDIQVTLYR
jgi:cyclopropane-fatty-acyl-phospholipid synthase